MSPKSYRLFFASHSSISSPSGFSRGNLGLHVGEFVCDKYPNFSSNSATVMMVHGKSRGLSIYMQVETLVEIHWAVISFSLKPISTMLSQFLQEILRLVKLPNIVGSAYS